MDFSFGLLLALFVIAALTMPAGIGGGILFTPLLQSAGGLNTKQAAALSQILISGAATASIMFNIWQQLLKRDEDALRIQAHYIYLSLPALLSGTLTGVYLGKLLPNILQMLALFGICSYGSYSIIKRAMKTYQEESAALRASGAPTSQVEKVGNPSLSEPMHVELVERSRDPPVRKLSSAGAELPSLNIKMFVGFISALFIGTVFLTIIKGGKGLRSIFGVRPCGGVFFSIVIVQILVEIGIALYYAPKEYRFILESWVIGVITTMTGASPGILQNPLMMSKGLSPVHSTPISVIITFLTASTSSLDYLMGGIVPFWMVFLSSITFAGSIAGMTGITYLIKKTGRPSLIIFLLGVMAAIGGFTVLLAGITGAFASIKNGDNPLSFEITC